MKKRITVLLMAVLLLLPAPLTAFAADTAATSFAAQSEEDVQPLSNVTDAARILTDEEDYNLEEKAQAVSKKYGVGVYIVTVNDYTDYSSEGAYEAAYGIYHYYKMGEGEDRDGIMLFLSMEDRDWAMFCYGDKSEYAFNSYGQAQLEKVFLDNFKEDDWYGGFTDYINACDEYLEKAQEGHPVRKSPAMYILISVVVSLVVAFLIVYGLVSKMKNVGLKATANAYVNGNLHLTRKSDRFTHRTTTRVKIQREPPSGGSTSHSGGGGSGRSGKF